IRSDLDGEASLARPPRAGQRQQAGAVRFAELTCCSGEQPSYIVDLMLAPDEARELDRQVVGMRGERAKGREFGGQVRVEKLEHLLRLLQVLEAVVAPTL